MYLRGNSIGSDRTRRTDQTDQTDRHTLNPFYDDDNDAAIATDGEDDERLHHWALEKNINQPLKLAVAMKW